MREKTIYEKIAKKYNTTPEEVRREMQIAIDAGFDNPDPDVQEEWKKMTLKGDRPTPEDDRLGIALGLIGRVTRDGGAARQGTCGDDRRED